MADTAEGPAVATALYRFYDTTGALLYIGITDAPRARWYQHARDKEWWPEVSRRELTWFSTRELAANAEAAAIKAENPPYNHTHSPSPLLAEFGRTAWSFREAPSYHRQMATHLRQLVIEGEAKAGDRYPTTAELAEYFGVSTVTVQNALLVLKEIGFAVGKPGKAVYISIPYPTEASEAVAIGTSGAGLALVGSDDVLPSLRVLTAMGLAAGTRMTERRWVRHDSGKPVEYIREYRLQDGKVSKMIDRLWAIPPTIEVVRALELHRDATVLTILRVHLDAEGRCLSSQVIAKHGDSQGVVYEY